MSHAFILPHDCFLPIVQQGWIATPGPDRPTQPQGLIQGWGSVLPPLQKVGRALLEKQVKDRIDRLRQSFERIEQGIILSKKGNGGYRWFLRRETGILLRRSLAATWEALRLFVRHARP